MADTRLGKIGITVKEPWAADISYEVLDVTLYAVEDGGDGCSYTALRDNIGVTPGTDPNTWVKSTQAGQSIYDLAVKYHHFEGTEEEFEAEYQAVLQAARDAAADASAVEAQVEAAEALRVAAETGRADAESARQSAEASRASAETARGTAEAARQSAESGRASAETARVTAEQGRVSAESDRVSAEAARAAAETDRVSDFSALKTDMETAIGQADAATAAAVATNNQIQTAEASRVSAEQGRVSAETSRAGAESARATAESGRATAETARATAEGQRATAEGQRVTAENARVSAESGRASAESARVTAEASRVSAETARESQASSDHTRAESDHAIAAEDHATLDEKIAHKADIDGYYGGMTVGTAENLVGRGTTEAEYVNRRTSAGTADIGSGSAAITRIKGRSQVWNQLVRNGNFESTTNWSAESSSSFSVSGGVASITPAAQYKGIAQGLVGIVAGHKYFVKGDVYQATDGGAYINGSLLGTNINVQLGSSNLGVWKTLSAFVTAGTGSSSSVGVCTTKSSGFAEIKAKNIIIYDLTLLGIDNLTTVEEVEAWMAENIGPLDYYAYNPGEVINNAAEGIKTRGFNLFNYATGKAYLPGKYSDYPYEYEICGTFTSISFTDVNGNTSVPELHDGRFFNVDAPGELTVVGGNNTDTLVHLVWSGWRNYGEPDYVYEPYWENTLNLGLTSLTGKLNGEGSSVVVFPHGLAKIGDVQDEIVGNRAIKRVGVVDLGTLNYTKGAVSSSYPYGYFASTVAGRSLSNTNILSAKYPTVPAWNVDKVVRGTSLNSTIYVIDSAYAESDAATFKSAMQGVLLYYELATPEEYILDNPPQFNYRVDDFSTEETVPSYDPSNVIAPLAYDVQYAMNAVDAIRRLPDNYVERKDVKQATGDSEKFVLSQKAVNDNYAKKVGVEDNLTVGLAKNIEGNATSGGYPFTFVKISGTDGLAKINDVRGNSLVWNQLVDKGDFTNSSTANSWLSNGPTKTYEDNSMKLTGSSANQSVYRDLSYAVAGHKYLCLFTMKASDTGKCGCGYGGTYKVDVWNVGTSWKTFGYILTTASTNKICYIYATLTNDRIVYVKYANIFDLTLLFGAGNEPSTVEEFEALFPLPYYDYNAGEIISNKTEQVKVVGFNQWDEQWEVGSIYYTTGQDFAASGYIRSKGYIPVIAGKTYYIKAPANTNLIFYDATKAFVGTGSTYINIKDTTFTVPSGAGFLRFALGVGTYANDICINLSDPAKNGTYEPYKTNTIELNLPTLTGKVNGEGESVVIAADGLKSAGSVYDEGIVENGYLTKIVKRIGVVDMGTLTWVKETNLYQGHVRFVCLAIADYKGGRLNILSQKYVANVSPVSTGSVAPAISGYDNKRIYILDDNPSYTDAATFTTAMSGVLLYYELAEPVTYVLDTPIPATFQSYKDGTLKQIPENGSTPTTAAHAMSVTYAIDIASIATGLPKDYTSADSLKNLLIALQSAGVISGYTMTYDDTLQEYKFTISPVTA